MAQPFLYIEKVIKKLFSSSLIRTCRTCLIGRSSGKSFGNSIAQYAQILFVEIRNCSLYLQIFFRRFNFVKYQQNFKLTIHIILMIICICSSLFLFNCFSQNGKTRQVCKNSKDWIEKNLYLYLYLNLYLFIKSISIKISILIRIIIFPEKIKAYFPRLIAWPIIS